MIRTMSNVIQRASSMCVNDCIRSSSVAQTRQVAQTTSRGISDALDCIVSYDAIVTHGRAAALLATSLCANFSQIATRIVHMSAKSTATQL
jgi:hypothetical protein